jgi:oxygen-independent coproporphyrinogen-3 oxidase
VLFVRFVVVLFPHLELLIPSIVNLLQQPPLSLYVHIPWCARKCPYCDFNSHQAGGDLDEKGYVEALLLDLEYQLPLVEGRELISIFIGGGTPSLFSAASIGALLIGVRSRLGCHQEMEVTLEANPGTLEAGRYAGYRDAGVNRLSIGVQSLTRESLIALGRIHDPEQAVAAVQTVKSADFDRLNLDLMFGLPGQCLAQAEADLQRLIALAPDHISYYQLTLEPNTPFHRTPPPLPVDDTIWEMQQQGHQLLAAAGFEQYEVSAFARPGASCRHNLNYWTFGDYLGIGAGAHGKITDVRGARIRRQWRIRDPRRYLASAGGAGSTAGERWLDAEDLRLEFMLNALRLNQGFSPTLFEAHTGLPIHSIQSQLDQAREAGLLSATAKGWHPTPLGRQFLNDLQTIFI